MVTSISLLEQQVKSGAVAFNREYYLNLRQRRISREHMRNASDEVPELQKEKRSEMQL